MLLLILTIVALQQYFDKIWNEAVYEKVLAPPSEQLQDLRDRDDWNLTHYSLYRQEDRQVRIPLDQAMELFAKEAAAGKLFYPAKEYASREPEEPAPLLRAAAAPAEQRSRPLMNVNKRRLIFGLLVCDGASRFSRRRILCLSGRPQKLAARPSRRCCETSAIDEHLGRTWILI